MADTVSPEDRSRIMSHIRSKNTKIEVKVRQFLFAQGFRYRINDKRYAGRPDIVLPKYRTVVFIHGCFWHNHQDCKIAHVPKSNTGYWTAKIARNVEHDRTNKDALEHAGWKVITIWECEINKDFDNTMARLISDIKPVSP